MGPLAIGTQVLVDRVEVVDSADLVRLARISRIMTLTLLAPDIQEALLFRPPPIYAWPHQRRRRFRDGQGVAAGRGRNHV